MAECSCDSRIDSRYLCMKYNEYVCSDGPACRDPQLYCKHRPACTIWFMTKRRKGQEETP